MFKNIIKLKNISSKGFTLIELVIVIVLLGIAGSIGSEFISQAFLGFASANSRMEIYEEGKLAMMRMGAEIRNAVPNAVELVGSDDLRLGMIHEGKMKDMQLMGRYKETAVDFPTADLTDDDPAATLSSNLIVSIFNQTWTQFSAGTRLFKIASALGNAMTLDGPVSDYSPRSRYYIVDQAVRFYLSGTDLYREVLPVNEGGLVGTFPSSGYLLAKDISWLRYKYLANPVASNSSLVVVDFTITKNGESVDFHKEVHIRNVP